MRRNLKYTLAALTAAAVLGAPQAAAAQSAVFPGPGEWTLGTATYLYASGSEIFVQYLGYEAAYENVLSFWVEGAGMGTISTPTFKKLFANKDIGTANGDAASVGQVFKLNDLLDPGESITTGSRVIFSLFVRDISEWGTADPDDAGKTYYTDLASTNPDGQDHAKIATYTGSGTYGGSTISFDRQIGFEDILEDNDDPNPDWDYDDLVFATHGVTVPEPASLLLLGSGLIGVVGVAYRRRDNDLES